MVSYSFKNRFRAGIIRGTKKQTIRSIGKKRHTRPGERMTCTTGDRFHPKLLGEATCRSVDPIYIDLGKDNGAPFIRLSDGNPKGDTFFLDREQLDDFARLDGFEDWPDMAAFWATTHPDALTFEGVRIFWGDTFNIAPTTLPAGETT